jgi:hypothetical protein
MLHEVIHKFADPSFRLVFGSGLDEGVTQYFTNVVLQEYGLPPGRAYPERVMAGYAFAEAVGLEELALGYFLGPAFPVLQELGRAVPGLDTNRFMQAIRNNNVDWRQVVDMIRVPSKVRIREQQRIFRSTYAISQQWDPYEYEANRVAERVMGRQSVQQPMTRVSAGSRLMRAPQRKRRRNRSDKALRELAVWPDEALSKWKHLNEDERSTVMLHMFAKYGDAFMRLFQEYALGKRTPKIETDVRVARQWPDITPEWFAQRGYRFAGYTPVGSGRIEYWVHPSGKQIRRTTIPEAQARGSEPEERLTESPEPEPAENPQRIDPSADPEKVYGLEVASAQDAAIFGQRGYAVQYADGTIELFVEGASAPITYRPQPETNNAYDYYDEQGEKLEVGAILLDPVQIFGEEQE